MGKFPLPLLLEDIGTKNGTQIFRLLEDFVYLSDKQGELVCPKGFESTGISTPRIIWPLIGPTSGAFKISIFHDYIFSKDCLYNFNRQEADYIMLEGMMALNVPWVEREVIHKALRMFSWMFWKKS